VKEESVSFELYIYSHDTLKKAKEEPVLALLLFKN